MAEVPAIDSPPKPPRVPRTGGIAIGFLAGLAGGIAVLAVAVAALAVAWPTVRDSVIPPNDVPTAAIDALTARVAALEAAVNRPVAADPELAKLGQRVSTLEQAPHSSGEDPRVGALVTKTDQLADQVATLHAASGDAAEMEKKVARAENAAQSAHDAAAHRQSAEALLIVAGQLRDAVDRGAPYGTELAAARKVAPPSAAATLDALATSADTGVSRRSQLADTFAPVASAIARAALVPPETDDFWGRLIHEAATLVSVRRVDGQGSDPASAAARAEKAVRAGDLSGAAKELEALDGAPGEAAKTWLTAARARLAADHALSDLNAAVATALAGGDG